MWRPFNRRSRSCRRRLEMSGAVVQVHVERPTTRRKVERAVATAGKGSTYMAGALVGRVGDAGKIFLIGERYDGSPGDEGRLWMQIVPSPWNNASTGSYRVRVTTDQLALTSR